MTGAAGQGGPCPEMLVICTVSGCLRCAVASTSETLSCTPTPLVKRWVWLTGGAIRQVRWLGFLSLDQVRATPDARPVKIDVARYSDTGIDWIDLRPGEFVQGCLVAEGVYAVTTSSVRIITNRARDE